MVIRFEFNGDARRGAFDSAKIYSGGLFVNTYLNLGIFRIKWKKALNLPNEEIIFELHTMSNHEFATMALSFPGTEENPHFDRRAFKVTGRRIFATLHEKSRTANLKLSPVDQSVFCLFDKKAVYAVPNKWGVQGWTTFELKHVPKELMLDALDTAYKDVGSKKKGK